MAANDVDVVDFEAEEDDLMDEEVAAEPDVPHHRLRSAITGGAPYNGAGEGSGEARRTKGRGFREEARGLDRGAHFGGRSFDSLESGGGPGPAKSVEGWIVLVTGLHEEAQEDDIHNAFREYGQLKNLHLNLDRRTGYVKGYALIEYESFNEAHSAIRSLDRSNILGQTVSVDWAFSNGPSNQRNARRRSPRRRSRSPPRRY